MKNKRHLIVLDPTAFAGGSKIATESILALLDKQQLRITVLTADKSSWHGQHLQHADINRIHLHEAKWLAEKEQGVSYFLRHFFIAVNLLLVCMRQGRFDIAVGASGPGVDLALYLLSPILKYSIIQLVHGPVAKSRTIARCLKRAQQVYYLQSSYHSIQNALTTLQLQTKALPDNFQLFQNGLSEQSWPSQCQTDKPAIFWAASLLKWKGLDLLLQALQLIPEVQRPVSKICYIKPQGVQLAVTQAPRSINKVCWYESPSNLDQLRASSNIFVSTSFVEPFGLSILEAMAAGQCVVIPADGAYWDQRLVDGVNCIKYKAQDSHHLSAKLLMLSKNLAMVTQLGQQAVQVAKHYRAQKQYADIVNSILAGGNHKTPKQVLQGAEYDQ